MELPRHEKAKPDRGPLGVRRPKVVLGVSAVLLAVLALLGLGVEEKLKSTSLEVPGTESQKGNEMLADHFGESAPFAVLLQGPAGEIERQGPRLVSELLRRPGVTALSPWDRGTGLAQLRPNPRTALVLVDFHTPLTTAIEDTVPEVRRILDRTVSSPVEARTASYAGVARAIQDESIETTRRGELIVTPILLLVLLLVFRSPIAAAIPLAFGGITVIASRGLMSIAAEYVEISGFALSIASMIGLALGVDYALLIVSRFREELRRGADPAEAAIVTRGTAGRTTAFAGSTLLISMLIAVFLVPGALLVSLCSTVVAVIVLAVAGPWLIGPALLVTVGRNVDRWRIGKREPTETRWLAVSRGALRNPAIGIVLSAVFLLLFAAPALSLSTAPLTIKQLPEDNSTRLDVEAVETAVGGGWIAPSIVVVASERNPVTEPRRLAELNSWQSRIAADPAVAAVVGPGPLVERIEPLRRAGQGFLDPEAPGGLAKLAARLQQAHTGLTRLRRGLGRASEGAHALSTGSARAETGADLLAGGLERAASGGTRAGRALERFSRGAHLIAAGGRSAGLAAFLVEFSAQDLVSQVKGDAVPEARRLNRALTRVGADLPTSQDAAEQTLEKLEAAWRELEGFGVGSTDPRYPALAQALREALTAAGGADPVDGSRFAPGYRGLPSELATLDDSLQAVRSEAQTLRLRLSGISESVRLLRRLSRRLGDGVDRLARANDRLAGGSDLIVAGADRLRAGLERLDGGARRLAGGLSRLRDGNAALARGLSSAFVRTRPLVVGAGRVEARVLSARDRLRTASPGFFESGYFVLSALDGAPARGRELAGQALDLDHGGQAAQILVVSNDGLDSPGVKALNERLRDETSALARRTGTEAAVTGGISQTTDYTTATTSRLPLLIIAITVITFLAMIAILRAVPLAAIAIVLNLFTVAAGFGVLSLMTLIPEGAPFGGASHVDPIGAAGIFGVVFGLSIDYSVFLLMRMREHWEQHGDNEAAIEYGLRRTASVITGAATIMAIVFGVFATAPIDTVAQFGVGLTVAIVLDATVIRLMLLPALMKTIGPRVWWLPKPLAKRLPELNVHG
jgi:putative drug exporter of the RND superfamily